MVARSKGPIEFGEFAFFFFFLCWLGGLVRYSPNCLYYIWGYI